MNGIKQRLRTWLSGGGEDESARHRTVLWILLVALLTGLLWWVFHPFREQEALLVVSYDVTREYFGEVNGAYAALGDPARVILSHAGSVRQARNVARGLQADVVHLASAADMDRVASDRVAVGPGWREQFPHGSSPYTSTIVFLVRKGNPAGIRDWNDLFREEVRVAAPDPLVSGAGQFAYLAATAMATQRHLVAGRLSADIARLAWEDLVSLYTRIELIELGARQALDVFRRRSRGDVFLTWESEALRLGWSGDRDLEMVVPSASLLAEPVIALVDAHVDERGTRQRATRYVEFLFSPEGQAIAARHGFRPRFPVAGAPDFPPVERFTLEAVFGDAEAVWQQHFGQGGSYEAVLRARLARRGGVE